MTDEDVKMIAEEVEHHKRYNTPEFMVLGFVEDVLKALKSLGYKDIV